MLSSRLSQRRNYNQNRRQRIKCVHYNYRHWCGYSEKPKKITDPFFTSPGEGTGLGLSITYNIIKEHKENLYLSRKKERLQ